MRFPSLAAALSGLLLVSCAPQPAAKTAPPAAKPALWKLADEDTTIWLFGTIHVLPPGYKWRGPTIDRAIDRSDSLVVEAVLDRDPAKSAALLLSLGRSPGLKPLVERVPADKRAALQALIQRSGIPPAALDAVETWAASLMLVGVTLTDLGVGSDDGVEKTLEDEYRRRGRPVEGLETPHQQLGYFDRLPESAQVEFLLTLLDNPANAREDFDAMLAAWARGDEAAIAATFDEDFEKSPHLRDVLVKERNAAWAEWLKARMAKPGAVFVAVGAGHLAGPLSVPRMLEAEGLKVARVQ